MIQMLKRLLGRKPKRKPSYNKLRNNCPRCHNHHMIWRPWGSGGMYVCLLADGGCGWIEFQHPPWKEQSSVLPY